MTEQEDICLDKLERIQIRPIRGIYFLYDNDELVYIGQSSNIIKRIHDHIHQAKKSFNAYKYIEIDIITDLTRVEISLIRKYKPKYNVTYKHTTEDYSRKIVKTVDFEFLNTGIISLNF